MIGESGRLMDRDAEHRQIIRQVVEANRRVRIESAHFHNFWRSLDKRSHRMRGDNDSLTAHSRFAVGVMIPAFLDLFAAQAKLTYWEIKERLMLQNNALALQTIGADPTGYQQQPQALSLADMLQYGDIFAKSGYFKDASDPAKAVVKILAGAELGLNPFASMNGIYIIEGKPSISSNLLAGMVKRSGKYDFRLVEHTNNNCAIEFYQLIKGEWALLGKTEFSMEDASRAQLATKDNWKKYPRAMMFARAISFGVKVHCPDIYLGGIYVEGERNEKIDAVTGDTVQETVIDARFAPQPATPQSAVSLGATGAMAALPQAKPTLNSEQARQEFVTKAAQFGFTGTSKEMGALVIMLLGETPKKWNSTVWQEATGKTETEWMAAIAMMRPAAQAEDEDEADPFVDDQEEPGTLIPIETEMSSSATLRAMQQ